MGRVRRGGPERTLLRRWALTVFLPTALCIALAAASFALYAFFSLETRRGAAVIFALCVGGVLILAVWLLGSAHLRRLSGALRALTELATRISDGSFGLKVEALPEGELGALAAEINALSEEIARSGKLQTEFISSVSHELRTPLTAITGWAEALSYDAAIRGESRRGVEIIARETDRLAKMVEELLEFTRIQDGRFRLQLEPVDPAAEVEDAVFTYSRLLQQEKLALRCDYDPETVPMVEADPERLRQVLLNLLDNAVKYGRDGGSIEVSLETAEGFVVIAVRDHGPGIPEAELAHVKERFYKGSGKARGSGIGLAVCEEIVNRHGGRLRIENAPGGGVVAQVWLPICTAPANHAEIFYEKR